MLTRPLRWRSARFGQGDRQTEDAAVKEGAGSRGERAGQWGGCGSRRGPCKPRRRRADQAERRAIGTVQMRSASRREVFLPRSRSGMMLRPRCLSSGRQAGALAERRSAQGTGLRGRRARGGVFRAREGGVDDCADVGCGVRGTGDEVLGYAGTRPTPRIDQSHRDPRNASGRKFGFRPG